jgi:hypothetical protein
MSSLNPTSSILFVVVFVDPRLFLRPDSPKPCLAIRPTLPPQFAKKNQNLSATKPELTEEDLSAFGNPDPAYKGVVRMRGLPFRAIEEDVVDFFEGYTIVPDGVFLCRLADGRLSGDVSC